MKNIKLRIIVKGRVQGVGFRPTVYRYAKELKLTGWVKNSTEGVIIEVEGEKTKVDQFVKILNEKPPNQSQITQIQVKKMNLYRCHSEVKPKNLVQDKLLKESHNTSFKIINSKNKKGSEIFIPPDMSICDNCLHELLNKNDRRYLYPFINCTNCGPRFTIIENVPYDRTKTTMRKFKMCNDCAREYNDSDDRRFHAQPNACPVCGPEVVLVKNKKNPLNPPLIKKKIVIQKTIELLKRGKIIAIKSLGGFHLACDATNKEAVLKLRLRKNRPDKPFALMIPDIETIKKFCEVSAEEERLLTPVERPIVLLKKRSYRKNIKLPEVVDSISPGIDSLGVMLPYTPLHYLLFFQKGEGRGEKVEGKTNFTALVMTSGNKQDEPICRTNEQALEELNGIADYFLLHNRDIFNRCDDSIVQVLNTNNELRMTNDKSNTIFIRRSRGYVPNPILIDSKFAKSPSILSCGAELKNTFCLTRNNEVYMSQYIGDLKDEETYEFYQEAIKRLTGVLRVRPEIVVHDLHPDYLSTWYALEFKKKGNGRQVLPVQHHQAHIASVLAEYQITEPVIGVSFDGVGYGEDGNLWGGEFFCVEKNKYQRVAHFGYFPLPGGDEAVENIWRIGYSLLYKTFEFLDCHPEHSEGSLFVTRPGFFTAFRMTSIAQQDVNVIKKMIDQDINSPLTSSVGRLFDGVASIIGLRDKVTYEAQAAMELESLALVEMQNAKCKMQNDRYKFKIDKIGNILIVDYMPIIQGIVKDLEIGVARGIISLKFHYTLAYIILEVCKKLAKQYKTKTVAMSGGVFQNRVLTEMAIKLLKKNGFIPLMNQLVPANDGGISLGQCWIVINNMIK